MISPEIQHTDFRKMSSTTFTPEILKRKNEHFSIFSFGRENCKNVKLLLHSSQIMEGL